MYFFSEQLEIDDPSWYVSAFKKTLKPTLVAFTFHLFFRVLDFQAFWENVFQEYEKIPSETGN